MRWEKRNLFGGKNYVFLKLLPLFPLWFPYIIVIMWKKDGENPIFLSHSPTIADASENFYKNHMVHSIKS